MKRVSENLGRSYHNVGRNFWENSLTLKKRSEPADHPQLSTRFNKQYFCHICNNFFRDDLNQIVTKSNNKTPLLIIYFNNRIFFYKIKLLKYQRRGHLLDTHLWRFFGIGCSVELADFFIIFFPISVINLHLY